MAKTCQAVFCDSASLRSFLAGLSTREASAEVGQLLRCRRVRARPPSWWSYVPAKAF